MDDESKGWKPGEQVPGVASWAALKGIDPSGYYAREVSPGVYDLSTSEGGAVTYRITDQGQSIQEKYYGDNGPTSAAERATATPLTTNTMADTLGARDDRSERPKGLAGVSRRVAWDLTSMTQTVNWLADAHTRANTLVHKMPEIMDLVGQYPSFSFGTHPAGKIAYQKHTAFYHDIRTRVAELTRKIQIASDATRQVAKNYADTEDRNQMNVDTVKKLFQDSAPPAATTPPGTASSSQSADTPTPSSAPESGPDTKGNEWKPR